jgi:hypothetical protein
MHNKQAHLLCAALLALTFSAGCRASASAHAGSSGGTEIDRDRRAHRTSGAEDDAVPSASSAALTEGDTSASAAPKSKPAEHDAAEHDVVKHDAAGDSDRGHGNDADGADADNPGKSKSKKKKGAKHDGDHDRGHGADADHKHDGDHDRGHGNDTDRVDEDNPGKSKKHD